MPGRSNTKIFLLTVSKMSQLFLLAGCFFSVLVCGFSFVLFLNSVKNLSRNHAHLDKLTTRSVEHEFPLVSATVAATERERSGVMEMG